MSEFVTINTTLKVNKKELNSLENELKACFELIDFKVLPDTNNMYNEDPIFKAMSKQLKKYKEYISKYINENNTKFNV